MRARLDRPTILRPRAAPSPAPQDPGLPRPRAGGARALARARHLPRVRAPPPGRRAVGVLRGAADRERAPGLPPRARARVQGHLPALPDDARPLRRAQGRLGLPRPAGRDRGRAEARLPPQGRHRALRHRRVQPAVPRVGLRVPRGLDGADRADRLLGRPRAPLPHARPRLHRVGLVGAEDDVGARPAVRGPQGRALLRALRHRAVLARGRAGLRGRRGPLGLRRVPGHRARRPAARRRPAAGLDDDAVDAALARRARRRARPRLRAHRGRLRARRGAHGRACSARTRASPSASTGATSSARATSRRSTSSRPRSTGPRATPCCPATSSAPRTAPASCTPSIAFGEDDYRLGQEQGIAVINPVRLDGTYDERMGPVRRPLGQGGRPGHRRGPARARPAAARGDLPARLPALLALRHAAALLRQAVVVHRHLEAARPPAGRQRDRRLAPRSTSSTGASGAGWRTTSTGRSRASATGARRCRCGAARTATRSAWARWPSSRERSGDDARGPAPALRRRADLGLRRLRRADAARARGDRRLVRLGLHAVRPAARAVREPGAVRAALSRRTTSARRSTRRAAGSTR